MNFDDGGSRWWRFVEMTAYYGSPTGGRVNARHPMASGLAAGTLVALLFLLDGSGFIGAVLTGGVVFALIYGNGRVLRAYLNRGGVFGDQRSW